jgi:LAO/AO transport system kinase
MATRGSLGGLSRTAQEAADLMSAAGLEIVIFETVGVGQGELDVAQATDTTVVTRVPESGDSIQAMKAGLMEIADIFVINKADREGAEKLKIELEMMLQLRSQNDEWNPPILKTVAQSGEGIKELQQQIVIHSDHLKQLGILKNKRSKRLYDKIELMIVSDLREKFWNDVRKQYLSDKLSDLMDRKITPQNIIEDLYKLAEKPE